MTLARLLRSDWHDVAKLPLTNSKLARILELCTGRDVLDCGCVGDYIGSATEMALTSHFRIASAARHCVGVDIVAGEIAKRRALGYDVRHANVETMSLGENFDVAVAVDLIEHLSNPGQFLDTMHEHLRPEGLLCLVTPNPWSANAVLKALVGIRNAINAEHTCWYDPTTLLQLLHRHGFEPIESYWQDYHRTPFVSILTRVRPNLAAHFIVVARRRSRQP